MSYLVVKALHLIFVVCWFAGLFYIVRLFIYHTEATSRSKLEREVLINQFLIMERRLWFGITWPAMILTILFGGYLLKFYFPLSNHPWLIDKLCFVFLLVCYHLHCGKILKNLKNNIFNYSSKQLRIYNEVATLFLFVIVFLVVLKIQI